LFFAPASSSPLTFRDWEIDPTLRQPDTQQDSNLSIIFAEASFDVVDYSTLRGIDVDYNTLRGIDLDHGA
jgi:hypothetical protein